MTLAFSTSSPIASVALIDEEGSVRWSDRRESRHQASFACLEMLEKGLCDLGLSIDGIDRYAADIGPGSFTGVRVGIVLAKTFAFVHGKKCVGADSFDLISPTEVVVQPSKKGEYFVRRPNEDPVRQNELPEVPFVGFGFAGGERYPMAAAFAPILRDLTEFNPEAFAPMYLIEPSISQPKRPFGG